MLRDLLLNRHTVLKLDGFQGLKRWGRPRPASCAGEAALLHLALRPGSTDLSARPQLARELQR